MTRYVIRHLAVAVVLLLAGGCAVQKPGTAAEIAINAGGTHTDRSSVYATVAAQGVAVAKPRCDAAGQLVLAGVEKNLSAVLAENDLAKAEYTKALNQVHSLEDEDARSKAEVAAIKKQWGYRLQIWVTWAFWILMGLVAIHFIGAALALLLPPPYGTIASVVGKAVNPFGWLSWLVTKIQENRAVAAVVPGGKNNPIGV